MKPDNDIGKEKDTMQSENVAVCQIFSLIYPVNEFSACPLRTGLYARC